MVCRGAPPSFNQPLLLLSHFLSYLPFLGYTSREKDNLARTLSFFKSGNGYFAVQSTKPQTLGYGLADSPVGLLAWIYEKLVGWTDAYPWEDDEGEFSTRVLSDAYCVHPIVLTWISVYQFSRAGPTASLRIYYEILRGDTSAITAPVSTSLPVGYSHFPKELISFPRRYVC